METNYINILLKERERRAQERKNEKSAIIIQAAWRSLVSRRRTFKTLEENLSHILASSSLANNHRMAVSLFLVSSRCMTPDGHISTLVGILARQQEAKGFVIIIVQNYFINKV